jgi:pimeloyl-ACP methyl ester carboxylesterase
MLSYRGYGKSQGTPSEAGMKLDAKAALDYILQDTALSAGQIIVYGQSIGGAVAIDLCASHRDKIGALVVENTFLSVASMSFYLMIASAHSACLSRIKISHLFMHRKVGIARKNQAAQGTNSYFILIGCQG